MYPKTRWDFFFWWRCEGVLQDQCSLTWALWVSHLLGGTRWKSLRVDEALNFINQWDCWGMQKWYDHLLWQQCCWGRCSWKCSWHKQWSGWGSWAFLPGQWGAVRGPRMSPLERRPRGFHLVQWDDHISFPNALNFTSIFSVSLSKLTCKTNIIRLSLISLILLSIFLF